MKYNIKEAIMEDANTLDELLTKLIQDEKNYDKNINENFVVNNYYKNFINKENHCILVAKSDDEIIGYMYGYIIDNGEVCHKNGAKIDGLFIKDSYRKLGIAQKLIEEFKSWAVTKEAAYIEVNVLNVNLKAYNLYEKVGFKPVKSVLKLENI